MSQTFTAILKPAENGWWASECLEVQGAFSQGKTREESLLNLQLAVEELLDFRRSELRESQTFSFQTQTSWKPSNSRKQDSVLVA